MGRSYQFDCPLCHYHACVSGGADDGANCSVQTILCRDCRELYDVFTRIRKKVSEPAHAKISTRGLLTNELVIPPLMLIEHPHRDFQSAPRSRAAAMPSHWKQIALVCPVSKSHRIEPWNEPGRCPRCGSYLERNGFPYRLWD